MEGARQAAFEDVPRVLELTRALRDELVGHRGGGLWRRTHDPVELTYAELRALLGSRENAVVVGSIDDHVVGYALVRAHTLHDGGRLAEILELYVEPEAREVAVGEALVNWMLDWAQARGCSGIDATALPGDRAAKNFFETNGFVARSLTMHRAVGSPDDVAPDAQ